MGDLITQIGVGGVLALMIIDRVLTHLKGRNGSSSGDQPVDYWRNTFKEIVIGSMDGSVTPILRAQTEILSRLEQRSGQNYEMHLKQMFMLEDLQKSIERLRASSHGANDLLQRLIEARKTM